MFLLRTAVTDESVAAQLQMTFDRIVVGPLVALEYPDAERRAALIGSQLMGCVSSPSPRCPETT